jgi:shikimate kinase
MRIFLIGFMGVGKTTFGKRLAKRLAFPFLDLDHLIEEKTGSSVADYFAAHGEEAFRLLEKETLQHSSFPKDAVISTGGGAPCFFDNMDWMNKNGKTIYIQMPPASIANRLKNAKEERPLIKGLKGDDLVNFIEERLNTREVHYTQAQTIVDGHNLDPETVVQLLQL